MPCPLSAVRVRGIRLPGGYAHKALDNADKNVHTATMNTASFVMRDQPRSLTQRMRDLSKKERHKVMASAAETLAEYYRTDPEIQEWQALDGEDFYDAGDDGSSKVKVKMLSP